MAKPATRRGPELWQRAKKVIPGGNMLLSKRAEMFLPDTWPAYFSKANGCTVWDLDGTEYTDMSIMGIGTNTLGYGHPKVDEAVQRTIQNGNMSSLNCPEEVYLAERLVDIHPWADMARFARSGGEANAIAIRIARAASGKDKVAFCGYHGWHDWYLSANLAGGGNLDGHLLSGLSTDGVPRNLEDTVFPFRFNRLEELQRIADEHDLGVIKMEVTRNEPPAPGFLEEVRKLATDRGIVLVFDECTSGFRETFGGLHLKYGVAPDIIVLGKAIANGYALTAIVGRREVMEAAQTSFISSSFWTERIGPTAALATLDVMEETRSWEQISQYGRKVKSTWRELADNHGLELKINGIDAIPSFVFLNENHLASKTYVTQEMLKKGYLAANLFYPSIIHDDETLERYASALNPVFRQIADCRDGSEIESYLDGTVCHSGFQRLN